MASILSNASIASGGRLLNAGIGILVTVLLTRLLSPAGYGVYGAILSYAMLFQIAGDLGLYLTLTRLLGKSRAHTADIGPTVSLRIIILLVLFTIGLLFAKLFAPLPNVYPTLAILMIGLLLQSLSQLCVGLYQAKSVIWPATLGDTIGRLMQLSGIAWVFFYNHSQDAVLMAALMFTTAAAAAFAVHVYFLPHRHLFWPRISLSRWRVLIKVSWPLGLLLVLNTIYFRVDMVMLPIWRSPAEVGLYALAYRIIENLLFFPAMFGGLLLPRFSKLAQTSDRRAKQLLAETLKIVLLCSAGVGLVLLAVPDVLITYIAGQQFLGAAPLLQVLTLALVCMCFGNIFGFVLVAQGKSKALALLYSFLVVFNIIGNWLFIPVFGATAAAWTTVGTEILASATAGYLVLRQIKLSIEGRWILRWGLALAITIGAAFILPPAMPGLIRLLSIALLFTAMQALFGTVSKNQFPTLLHRTPETYE